MPRAGAHHRYANRGRGELALVQALLAQSLREALGQGIIAASNTPPQVIQREAQRWLLSDDVAWPFSFCNLCWSLGINPQVLRAQVWRRLRLRAAA